jgi:hypothetical protein
MMQKPSGHSCEPTSHRGVEPRLPVRGVARVKVWRQSVLARAVDICPYGVCLTLPRALEVGSNYQLELEIEQASKRRASVIGRVCFCVRNQEGYRVGLDCALTGFIG